MKLRKEIHKEEGYLLFENLLTMMIVMSILIVLFPLVIDWLVARQEAKVEVELSRVLYETTINWPEHIQTDYPFDINTSGDSVHIQKDHQKIGVKVLEAIFKE